MADNIAYALVDFDPTIPKINFRCGNNMFFDNVWDFNGLVDGEHLSGARLMIKFHEWEYRPQMLVTVKWFMVHELLTGKFNTAKRVYDGIKRFLKFVNEHAPEIDSFKDISRETMIAYFKHLLITKNETTGKPLGRQGIMKSAQAIKDLLLKGNTKRWEVPDNLRYLQVLYDDMIIGNKNIQQNILDSSTYAVKLPNKQLIDKIIKTALTDLESDVHTHVLTAASIIITTQTSLRINEFITLKAGCIETFSGEAILNHKNRKLTKEEVNTVKPANELVVKVVARLEELSLALRQESGQDFLFLTRDRAKTGYPVVLSSYSNWSKNYLRPWVKHHDLRDEDENLVDITSHVFRHAFATYAIHRGASLHFVSAMMGHKNIRGTLHYTHIIQEDVERRFAEVYNESAVISGNQALSIKQKLLKNNPFKGKTTERINMLRRAMKIQILANGFCTHHPMSSKKPCEGDGVCLGCNNFLSTPEFLPIHEGRLEKVRKELAEASENGPYEAKLRGIEDYLVDLISDLKRQMRECGLNV